MKWPRSNVNVPQTQYVCLNMTCDWAARVQNNTIPIMALGSGKLYRPVHGFIAHLYEKHEKGPIFFHTYDRFALLNALNTFAIQSGILLLHVVKIQ